MKNIEKFEKTLPIDEKRRFIRHRMCFPLNYRIVEESARTKDERTSAEKSGKKARSTSINVSMGGILFSARRPVKAGSVILIEMPFQDKIFNLRAMVAHCDKNDETKLYNIGAAFQKLSAAYKVKLVEQLCLISEFRDIRSIELGKQISLEKASKEWIRRYSDRFRRLYW